MQVSRRLLDILSKEMSRRAHWTAQEEWVKREEGTGPNLRNTHAYGSQRGKNLYTVGRSIIRLGIQRERARKCSFTDTMMSALGQNAHRCQMLLRSR